MCAIFKVLQVILMSGQVENQSPREKFGKVCHCDRVWSILFITSLKIFLTQEDEDKASYFLKRKCNFNWFFKIFLNWGMAVGLGNRMFVKIWDIPNSIKCDGIFSITFGF